MLAEKYNTGGNLAQNSWKTITEMASASTWWNWRPDGELVDDFVDCSRASLQEFIQSARVKLKRNQTIKEASESTGVDSINTMTCSSKAKKSNQSMNSSLLNLRQVNCNNNNVQYLKLSSSATTTTRN